MAWRRRPHEEYWLKVGTTLFVTSHFKLLYPDQYTSTLYAGELNAFGNTDNPNEQLDSVFCPGLAVRITKIHRGDNMILCFANNPIDVTICGLCSHEQSNILSLNVYSEPDHSALLQKYRELKGMSFKINNRSLHKYCEPLFINEHPGYKPGSGGSIYTWRG